MTFRSVRAEGDRRWIALLNASNVSVICIMAPQTIQQLLEKSPEFLSCVSVDDEKGGEGNSIQVLTG